MRASFQLMKETKPLTSPRTNNIKFINLLSDCSSILDIGCGRSSPLRFISNTYLVGLDACTYDLEQAKVLQTHDEYILGSANHLEELFQSKQYDACVALDVIEHLTKEEGFEFLRTLEELAKIRVVIFTPNGFLAQDSNKPGDHQEHLSGWKADEMHKLGYSVIGLDGLKILRTDHHKLRFHPEPLWAIISWFSQKLWCENHADSAAALLCWKEL